MYPSACVCGHLLAVHLSFFLQRTEGAVLLERNLVNIEGCIVCVQDSTGRGTNQATDFKSV